MSAAFCSSLKCLILFTVLALGNGAKILGVFHMPAYSHFQLGDRLFRELAARGHEVTVISSFELKEPVKNLRHVVLSGFIEDFEEIKSHMFDHEHGGMLSTIFTTDVMGVHFTEKVLNHTNVQKLLRSNAESDMVIHENFINEAFSGFGYFYKAPTVELSPMVPSRWANNKMGNPNNPAYVPDYFLGYSSHMTLSERILNTLEYIFAELLVHLYTYPQHNKLVQKYFPGAPHLYDLMYNTSLMLINSHTSISAAIPLLPNMIEIGGFHVQPSLKPLPKELQKFIDDAKEGFIYFSLGSNLKSAGMPNRQRDALLQAFSKLKHKVLWKWEEDVLPGQPANVKLGKWFPQQEILAHPNIKLFITHGGMLSTIEAIYYGVPVLGLPVFGDQELNIANTEHDGYGIGVPFRDVEESILTRALNELLTNPRYRQNVAKRSEIMHDQITKPLDRAIYWIEYVIKHRGAPYLKSPALSLSWYQNLLLDVVAALCVTLLFGFLVLYSLVRLICGKKERQVNLEKKRK